MNFWGQGLFRVSLEAPTGHVWMWELDCEESWAPKNWCFWIVVLEKTLEGPLYCKEIQPVHPKGDQPWDFFGRNDAKAETPVLWPPHVKSWLFGKDSDAGRDWGQEEKGTTEDEMAGWHHWLDGREFEWTLGDGDGQGGLACCDSWGRKESDTTERLNWTELNWIYTFSSSNNFQRIAHNKSSQVGLCLINHCIPRAYQGARRRELQPSCPVKTLPHEPSGLWGYFQLSEIHNLRSV